MSCRERTKSPIPSIITLPIRSAYLCLKFIPCCDHLIEIQAPQLNDPLSHEIVFAEIVMTPDLHSQKCVGDLL